MLYQTMKRNASFFSISLTAIHTFLLEAGTENLMCDCAPCVCYWIQDNKRAE